MIEVFIVGIIIVFVFLYTGAFNFNKFVDDNKALFSKLKEDDYEFLLVSKYGDNVDVNEKFQSRIKSAIVAMLFAFVAALIFFDGFNFAIKLVVVMLFSYLVYKDGYLKSLEILIQHYTVPVAITRSVEEAPEMFKPGLRELIASIDAGDSSIEPYMAFARRYPVRDSMRMMRLLYRLGLGSQERKQDQLIVFSRTISTLQNKSRETKYKERLEKMEKKTMTMLVATGAGVMVILVLSILQIFMAV